MTTMPITRSSRATWNVGRMSYARNVGYYTLAIVEKRGMEQDVIADAAQMARDIHETGKSRYMEYTLIRTSPRSRRNRAGLLEIVKFLRENPR